MASAQLVAEYFLALQDEDAGDTISNLKLQKLLYYAQGFHLAVFGVCLFEDEIEKWTHGPVVPTIYHEYKSHGQNDIPAPTDVDFSEIDTEFLNEVYNEFGQYSAWKLRNMTHDESPWVDANHGGIISHKSMMDYFSQFVVTDGKTEYADNATA